MTQLIPLAKPYVVPHLKRTVLYTKNIIIFIDVGHGGGDPGALGAHSRESDNVLKVALAMREMLIAYGFTVILSRTADKWVSLADRSSMANNSGATIFLSLHNNSAKSPLATGFETFAYDGPIGAETKRLQASIHNAIAPNLPIVDRKQKRANFSVLRRTIAPATLIEYAFINNRSDERLLMNEVNLLARTTVQGILDFFHVKARPNIPKESEVWDMKLTPTQQKDARTLFAHAYKTGLFSADHSTRVGKMTVGEAAMLHLQYEARRVDNINKQRK